MIPLKKGPIPQKLSDNQAAWTAELLAALSNGGEATKTQWSRYNQPEIKDALKIETNRKCAYCESKPLHVSPGDIEHVIPKSIVPDQAFHWPNLTLACCNCNNGKRNKQDFIDPYTDDLSSEFEFDGPMINHHLGRARAERTKVELDLNRTDLMEKRRERIDGLMDKLERLNATTNPLDKAFLANVILTIETAADKEYAACTRAWVAKQKAKGHL